MSTVYEIPCSSTPQRFTISLAGTTYGVRTFYVKAYLGGWCFDLSDAAGNSLACGRPLVTGCDLLGQLGYLGIDGVMFVRTDGDPAAAPTFDNLGTQSHWYFEVFS